MSGAVLTGSLDSNLLPSIPLAVGGPGDRSPLLDYLGPLLRPSITVTAPLIGDYHFAPYGEPIPGIGLVVSIALAVLIVYGAFRLLGG